LLASADQMYMDQRDELSGPPQPMLSIWGAADRSHPPGNEHSLVRLYAGVQAVTFDDLGHTPELEAPELVLATIRKLVGKRRHWTRSKCRIVRLRPDQIPVPPGSMAEGV
jgi:pimeloyl-ACP methyl ester carboxylesterase